MGCLGTILKLILYAFVICVVIGFIAGIVYTRKVLMSPDEVEQVEERYRQDTSSENTTHLDKPVKKKRKRKHAD